MRIAGFLGSDVRVIDIIRRKRTGTIASFVFDVTILHFYQFNPNARELFVHASMKKIGRALYQHPHL